MIPEGAKQTFSNSRRQLTSDKRELEEVTSLIQTYTSLTGLCNAPDTTFHIRNSNSCLFRRCDILFPSWLGFVFCFAFCSCHASHLMSSFTLHLRVFIKLASVRSCRVPPCPCRPLSDPLRAFETCPEPE